MLPDRDCQPERRDMHQGGDSGLAQCRIVACFEISVIMKPAADVP